MAPTRGRGARIAYTIVDSPLGRLLAAATERGLCAVFLGDTDGFLEAELERWFPAAGIVRDDARLAAWAAGVLDAMTGGGTATVPPLDMAGTTFQRRVWERLIAIPRGGTRTYREIAIDIGRPGAARAVGRACALNPVSVVVPCHRALGSDGSPRGYGWGIWRKLKLLAMEGAR